MRSADPFETSQRGFCPGHRACPIRILQRTRQLQFDTTRKHRALMDIQMIKRIMKMLNGILFSCITADLPQRQFSLCKKQATA